MKNLRKLLPGFRHERQLFGVSLNGFSVHRFLRQDGTPEMAVALVRNDAIVASAPIHKFPDVDKFDLWVDQCYEGEGRTLYKGDARLVVRAYPEEFSTDEE